MKVQIVPLFVLILAGIGLLWASCAPTQGISGKILWVTGNQMPGPEVTLDNGEPVNREVYVFEPTFLGDATVIEGVFYDSLKTHLVAKIKSGPDGKFTVKLDPGRYSVFIREPKGLFASQIESDGCIQCLEVNTGRLTEITIKINYTAAY